MSLLRPTALADAKLLATLHQASFGPEGWSVEQLRGSLALPTTEGLLYFNGEEPAGLILCQVLADQSEILTMCVLPSMRRQGFAAGLLRQMLVSLGEKTGSLWLEVAEDNKAAIGLYEKTGFRLTNRRKGYYRRPGGAVDALILSRAVGSR